MICTGGALFPPTPAVKLLCRLLEPETCFENSSLALTTPHGQLISSSSSDQKSKWGPSKFLQDALRMALKYHVFSQNAF